MRKLKYNDMEGLNAVTTAFKKFSELAREICAIDSKNKECVHRGDYSAIYNFKNIGCELVLRLDSESVDREVISMGNVDTSTSTVELCLAISNMGSEDVSDHTVARTLMPNCKKIHADVEKILLSRVSVALSNKNLGKKADKIAEEYLARVQDICKDIKDYEFVLVGADCILI